MFEISKFANDTKIASQVNILYDVRLMQRTLDKLFAWLNTWDMKFNVSKCRVKNIGKKVQFQYQMNGSLVKSVDEDVDLGVLINI